jgi:hypothetical protein
MNLCVDRIHVVKSRVQQSAVVNNKIKLRIHKHSGISEPVGTNVSFSSKTTFWCVLQRYSLLRGLYETFNLFKSCEKAIAVTIKWRRMYYSV